MAGKLRRPSRIENPSSPNQLYVALSGLIHQALVIPPWKQQSAEQILGKEEGGYPLDEVYITKRVSDFTPESRASLLNRMPDDIKLLAEPRQGTDVPLIGTLEMDLIDFILNYKDNRVLSVIGLAGVGKSTFLDYVFNHIRPECESLRKHLPLTINILKTGTNEVEIIDVARQLRKAMLSAAKDIKQDFSANSSCASILEESNWQISSISGFLNMVEKIKAICDGLFEPILVFDNVDQLNLQSVRRICDLGRGVFLDAGVGVIVAMRPPTFHNNLELSQDMGVFQRFRIRVSPPDLREIIRTRLRLILQSVQSRNLQIHLGNIRLQFEDFTLALERLIESYLVPEAQRLLLDKLSNNNIRHALELFERFLRYRDLDMNRLFPHLPQVHRSGDSIDTPEANLLDGIMYGSSKYYSDNKLLTNVFTLNILGRDSNPHYLILYRLISLLDWTQTPIEMRKLARWMATYGYNSFEVDKAVTFLLQRGLLFSPENEIDAEACENIALSACGDFYLTSLLSNPEYLYKCIYDVPLPHEKWDERTGDLFTSHMHSICELIQVLLEREGAQIDEVLSSKPSPPVLGAIKKNGLLVRRVASCAIRILEKGLRSRFDNIRVASAEYDSILKDLQQQVGQLEDKFDAFIREKHKSTSENLVHIPVGGEDPRNSFLEVPEELNPIRQNIVSVRLSLKSLRQNVPLVMLWGCTVDGFEHIDITPLTPRDKRGVFEGSLIIRNIESSIKTPPFWFTILQGNESILTRVVSSPESYVRK